MAMTEDVLPPLKMAGDLERDAKVLFERARGMLPSLDRNAVLEQARAAIKAALAGFESSQELDPGDSRDIPRRVQELQSMLYWCNKSLVLDIPKAPSPPDVLEMPGMPETPEIMNDPDREAIEAHCKRILTLASEQEKAQDLGDTVRHKIQHFLGVLSGERERVQTQIAAHPEARQQIAARFDGRRAQLIGRIRKLTDMEVQAGLRRQDLNIRLETTYDLLASRPSAATHVLGWAREHLEELPPSFVNHLNTSFAKPARPLPDPVPDPAVDKLLDEARDALAQQDHLTVQAELASAHRKHLKLLREECRRYRPGGEKVSQTASGKSSRQEAPEKLVSVGGQKLHEQNEAAETLPTAQDGRGGNPEKARKMLARRCTDLLAKVQGLPPEAEAGVEAWRRRQEAVPASLREALGAYFLKE